MSERLDGKFAISATSMEHGTVHDENDSVLFLAKDLAFLPALRFYRGECERIGAASAQLRGIDLLIGRVEAWQYEHPALLKVPDVDDSPAGRQILAPNEV